MKLSIEERIIQLCKERSELHKQGKNVSIYPFVSDQIFNEYGVRYDTEKLRRISRNYRDINKLNEYFELKQFNDKDAEEYKATIELNKDGTQTSDVLLKMSAEQAKDSDFLLAAHGYSIDDWELISARNNIWNVYSKVHGVQVLYSSKIVVKPRTDSISINELQKHFEEFTSGYKSPEHELIQYDINGKMLEVNIADLHLGKLSWHRETGDDYDWKIAKKTFLYIINDIITKVRNYKFEKILFIWCNDFFHFDTTLNTTTKGTRQDVDVRWQKLFKIGVEMLVEGIDLLSQIAPVHTFYLGSNHDKMTSFYAINYLDAFYRNCDFVTVDIDPKVRKYYEYGLNLIGFSHGDDDYKRLGSLMAIEAREAWGRTIYKECHAAHLHSEKSIDEENGVIKRRISSPTSTDAWHFENGFVGAVKKAQSFVWDREMGLEAIFNTVIK
jgi:hypothetical protein